MKRHSFFLILLILCLSAGCSLTGTDKQMSAPVIACSEDESADTAAPQDIPVDTIVIALTGDIMMGTTYPDNALPANEGLMLFNDVKAILQKADIAAGNLEGVLCDTTVRIRKTDLKHAYAFRTPVEFAPRLAEAGYDFLCMANNHSLDFGYDGVRSTENSLDRIGIRYAGLQGRSECAFIERGGVRYGFCAFGHNYYTLQHKNLLKAGEILDSLRNNADVVIVSFHGGGEGASFSHLPYEKEMFLNEERGDLRTFAHFCIDNGADVVFGHGPHVVRCIELYKDRFVAYSLGNFCTPYGISISGMSGYAPVIEARTDRSGRFLGGKIHSFIQKRGLGPRRDTTNIVARRIRELTRADIIGGCLNISPDGTITVVDRVGR